MSWMFRYACPPRAWIAWSSRARALWAFSKSAGGMDWDFAADSEEAGVLACGEAAISRETSKAMRKRYFMQRNQCDARRRIVAACSVECVAGAPSPSNSTHTEDSSYTDKS